MSILSLYLTRLKLFRQNGFWKVNDWQESMTMCQPKEPCGFQIKAVWSYAITYKNKGKLLCITTWLQCAFMHGHSHKPQVTETLSSWQNLLSYLASQGQRGASGIVSGLFRPYVQEEFLEVYQAWWRILYSRCSWERLVLAFTWGHFLPSQGTAGCVLELAYDRMSHQMAADWHQFLRSTLPNSFLLPPQGNLSIVQTRLSIIRQHFNIKGFIWNSVF